MRYHQGKFNPVNPHKYVGNASNIIFRSSWEKKLFIWLDSNDSILRWFSEEIYIPYISPVDNRVHRYFVDVGFEYKNRQGEIKRVLCEVKPYKQTMMPEAKGKNKQKFLTEIQTYAVNTAKWKAARTWASEHGWDFTILTEKELGIK